MLVEVVQQGGHQVGPGAVFTPLVEAVVDGLPGAVALGYVPPGCAAVQDPENAVEGAMMRQPRMSAAAVVSGLGQQRGDAPPLPGAEFVTPSHDLPPEGNHSRWGRILRRNTYARQSLVAWLLDVMTDARATEGLRESEEQLEAIRQKYGLEEDTPVDSDDVPAEYREAMRQVHDAWDTLYVQTLSEFCEHEMARLFQTDSEQFDRLYEAGRQFFHGTEDEDDDWLDELYAALVGCVAADSPMGPMGLRSWEEEGFWEVWVYPMPVELVGGRHDGAVVVSGFSFDLQQLREVFESVAAFGWNALGLNWPQGPHVYVEGIFQGREVYVQVLAYAPRMKNPG